MRTRVANWPRLGGDCRKIRSTMPGKEGQRARDLLRRVCTAPAPNRSWAVGFTHVATWSRIVYVSSWTFTRGPSSGWAAATHKRTRLILDALQMALCSGPGARRRGST